MTSFCVYGISKSRCKQHAEKKVSHIGMTVSEWGEEVRKKAAEIFESQDKSEQISPEFDAPQFCRDWIAAQPSEIRNATIMHRGPKIDKHGGTVMKKGMPVMTWIEYDESKVSQRNLGGF